MTKSLTIRLPLYSSSPKHVVRTSVKAFLRAPPSPLPLPDDEFLLPRPSTSYRDPQSLAKEISKECVDSNFQMLSYGVPLNCFRRLTISLPKRKHQKPVKVSKGMHALLTERGVRNPSYKTKEKMLEHLDYETLMKFALEQGVSVEDETERNKLWLVLSIWGHHLKHDHRLKTYKLQEELYSMVDADNTITILNTMKYRRQRLRKLFKLIAINRLAATIDLLEFYRHNHSYVCKHLWSFGLVNDRLLFCAIPCCSSATASPIKI